MNEYRIMKELIDTDDEMVINKMNFFIKENFSDYETGIKEIRKIKREVTNFSEFVDFVCSTDDADLKNVLNRIENLDLSFKYSQEDLKTFFEHQMTEDEEKKLEDIAIGYLGLKLQSPTYKIKFIENVGYMTIGEGYLIMDNSHEVRHYFAKIYSSGRYFKEMLYNKYKEEMERA